jgi:hypothetical protein
MCTLLPRSFDSIRTKKGSRGLEKKRRVESGAVDNRDGATIVYSV